MTEQIEIEITETKKGYKSKQVEGYSFLENESFELYKQEELSSEQTGSFPFCCFGVIMDKYDQIVTVCSLIEESIAISSAHSFHQYLKKNRKSKDNQENTTHLSNNEDEVLSSTQEHFQQYESNKLQQEQAIKEIQKLNKEGGGEEEEGEECEERENENWEQFGLKFVSIAQMSITSKVKYVSISKLYKEHNNEYDFAILHLKVPIGKQLGYLGILSNSKNQDFCIQTPSNPLIIFTLNSISRVEYQTTLAIDVTFNFFTLFCPIVFDSIVFTYDNDFGYSVVGVSSKFTPKQTIINVLNHEKIDKIVSWIQFPYKSAYLRMPIQQPRRYLKNKLKLQSKLLIGNQQEEINQEKAHFNKVKAISRINNNLVASISSNGELKVWNWISGDQNISVQLKEEEDEDNTIISLTTRGLHIICLLKKEIVFFNWMINQIDSRIRAKDISHVESEIFKEDISLKPLGNILSNSFQNQSLNFSCLCYEMNDIDMLVGCECGSVLKYKLNYGANYFDYISKVKELKGSIIDIVQLGSYEHTYLIGLTSGKVYLLRNNLTVKVVDCQNVNLKKIVISESGSRFSLIFKDSFAIYVIDQEKLQTFMKQRQIEDETDQQDLSKYQQQPVFSNKKQEFHQKNQQLQDSFSKDDNSTNNSKLSRDDISTSSSERAINQSLFSLKKAKSQNKSFNFLNMVQKLRECKAENDIGAAVILNHHEIALGVGKSIYIYNLSDGVRDQFTKDVDDTSAISLLYSEGFISGDSEGKIRAWIIGADVNEEPQINPLMRLDIIDEMTEHSEDPNSILQAYFSSSSNSSVQAGEIKTVEDNLNLSDYQIKNEGKPIYIQNQQKGSIEDLDQESANDNQEQEAEIAVKNEDEEEIIQKEKSEKIKQTTESFRKKFAATLNSSQKNNLTIESNNHSNLEEINQTISQIASLKNVDSSSQITDFRAQKSEDINFDSTHKRDPNKLKKTQEKVDILNYEDNHLNKQEKNEEQEIKDKESTQFPQVLNSRSLYLSNQGAEENSTHSQNVLEEQQVFSSKKYSLPPVISDVILPSQNNGRDSQRSLRNIAFQKEIQELKEQNSDLLAKLKEEKEKTTSLMEQLKEKVDENMRLKDTIQEQINLSKRIEDLESIKEIIQIEVLSKTQLIDQLQHENKSLKLEQIKIQTAKSEVIEEIKKLQEKQNSLAATITSPDENKLQQAENAQLKIMVNKLEEANKKMLSKIKKDEDEKQLLKQQISSFESMQYLISKKFNSDQDINQFQTPNKESFSNKLVPKHSSGTEKTYSSNQQSMISPHLIKEEQKRRLNPPASQHTVSQNIPISQHSFANQHLPVSQDIHNNQQHSLMKQELDNFFKKQNHHNISPIKVPSTNFELQNNQGGPSFFTNNSAINYNSNLHFKDQDNLSNRVRGVPQSNENLKLYHKEQLAHNTKVPTKQILFYKSEDQKLLQDRIKREDKSLEDLRNLRSDVDLNLPRQSIKFLQLPLNNSAHRQTKSHSTISSINKEIPFNILENNFSNKIQEQPQEFSQHQRGNSLSQQSMKQTNIY